MADTFSASKEVLVGTTTLPLQLNSLSEVELDARMARYFLAKWKDQLRPLGLCSTGPTGSPGVTGSGRAHVTSGSTMGSPEALKLGSLTETWKNQSEWSKFVSHLAKKQERVDSLGKPLTLARYAKFLELYVKLDQAEQLGSPSEDKVRSLALEIKHDPEDFFGLERCLSCIDRGMRGQILKNVRRVEKGEVKAGTWVYQPAYPRVVDKLNDLLGDYNSAQNR